MATFTPSPEAIAKLEEARRQLDALGFSKVGIFNVRSARGARDDVENWFINRFKQRWRY
ncbi:hypothetical protein [Bradyrhizobium sp. USDA 4508]